MISARLNVSPYKNHLKRVSRVRQQIEKFNQLEIVVNDAEIGDRDNREV